MISVELFIIRNIQYFFFNDKSDFIDTVGKVISGRKYRLYYLITIFVIYGWQFLICSINYIMFFKKFVSLVNLYFLGCLSRKLNILIKVFFKRSRPFFNSCVLSDEKTYNKKKNTFSFPSNSIQTSLIFYNVFLEDLLGISNFNTNLLLSLIVSLISLSKITKGLHYPSDILFSIIVYYLVKKIYYILLIPLLKKIFMSHSYLIYKVI